MLTNKRSGRDLKIEINGLSMAYDDLGAGEIPIVFLHGFPFDKSMWQGQTQVLAATNRVIAFDFRGFGASDPGNDAINMGLLADDLIRLLDALKIPRAIVCGLSMGGYVLMNAVTRYQDRFAGIVLCDTQCISDSPETREKRAQAILQIEDGKQNEYTAAFIKKVFCEETFVTRPEVVAHIESIMLQTSTQTVVRGIKALSQRVDMCMALRGILVPTLILCGDKDVVTPPAESKALADAIANSTNYVIKGAGHMSNLEQPDIFNQHLAAFIRETDSATHST
jgi:3-oxoadipate enol-lactonase